MLYVLYTATGRYIPKTYQSKNNKKKKKNKISFKQDQTMGKRKISSKKAHFLKAGASKTFKHVGASPIHVLATRYSLGRRCTDEPQGELVRHKG